MCVPLFLAYVAIQSKISDKLNLTVYWNKKQLMNVAAAQD
jgi:uncharacterized membrane protein